jgi:hypothetical protein
MIRTAGEKNPRICRDAQLRRDLYRQMLEEAEQEYKRYFEIKYACDDPNSRENNPRPYRDAELRSDLYRQMLEEAEQEDERYFTIKYAYEMADTKAYKEGKWNDDLEVIAIEMIDAVRSAQRDLWEKERAAR